MTCARQPDQATMEAVRKAVCKLRGLEQVVLKVKIDPAVLGGFILEIQGVTYDRSVRGRLQRLAQGLQEGDQGELNTLVEEFQEKIQDVHLNQD